MKKTLLKRITAVFLSLILVFGTLTMPVSAEFDVKEELKGIGVEKLVETGMRVAAGACEKLGEATGNEQAEMCFSFIADWVFSSGEEAAVNKVMELCEEIYERLDVIEAELEDGLSAVESMESQDAINTAKTNLENMWKSEVDDVIAGEKATNALDKYKEYLENAISYKKMNLSETELKAKVDSDLKELIYEFLLMYGGSSSMEDYNDIQKRKHSMFYDPEMNENFISMIETLAINLVNDLSGSVEECAVQYACNRFQFSHQQYSFVHDYAEKQILNLIMVEMMYNEYLYQQGIFINDYESQKDEKGNVIKDGKSSNSYKSYITCQNDFHTLMENTVKDKIEAMLNQELEADSSQTFSLDSYMKPEDAVVSNLKINEYRSSYTVDSETTMREYISENVSFNRVMTQTGNKKRVYYILDPNQFSDTSAVKAIAMDEKIEMSGRADIHIPSCDYLNLTSKVMSDGVNTFACTADIFPLFNTLPFRYYGSRPVKYLEGYLPKVSSDDLTLLMTPSYELGVKMPFTTTYESFEVMEGNSPMSGSSVITKDYSAELFQSDNGGDKYYYSVILANKSDDYKQKATLKIPAHMEASICNSKGEEIISTTKGDASPSAVIESGEMITLKFKVVDGYNLQSLKCIRNNSAKTETVLCDRDDLDILKTDGDYYTFTYPMPYSDTTFAFDAGKETYDIYTPQDLIDFSNDMNSGINTDTTANLCADIDMTGYEDKLSPIGTNSYPFKGEFVGNNHKISNLKFDEPYDYCGLFGYIQGADIKDLTVDGTYYVTKSIFTLKNEYVGGAVAYADGGTLTNIISNVKLATSDKAVSASVGGIVGVVGNNETKIEKCMYTGEIEISDAAAVIGGIVGVDMNGAKIINCANVGSIQYPETFGDIGGILGGATGTDVSIENSYNYTGVGNSKKDEVNCGAIIGEVYDECSLDGVKNNYYLDTTCDRTLGIDSNKSLAEKKTAQQLKSGEVTYLLNNKVTDGTQAWYQNIDNGKTPDDYPVFEGGTVYFGYVCDSESKTYSNYELSDEPSGHKFNDNGFCTICGQYQPATLNSGVYQITNGGNLFWFASLVNNDSTHADFDKQNTSANAVLVKDINLESREWSPIMNFSGTFNGNNHTISNLKITKTSKYSGLFGKTSGTIKSFTLNGDIVLSSDGDYVGGIVGSADGANISKVTSYVNISNTAGVLHHIGGVVGCIENKETFVDKCLYYGTLNIKDSHDCIGGIVGYSNAGARISNCANHGTVSASKDGAYVGGILGYVKNTNPTLKDCYNYGKVSNGNNTTYCGAIIGWARNYTTANIDNNYYLDSSSDLAFGSGGMSGATATAKTAEVFKSGEVTYLLNHKVTDGSQVWYQNIDNGNPPDDYPVFEGGTVYYLEYKDSYSNTYSEKPAFPEDGDGNFKIKTYDDLVKLSNLVRSDYEVYGSADYVLENNIKASNDSKWTQGIGSVSDNKPFNGKFDGKGYCIIGLNVNSPNYGGLFEFIGEKGSIKDLFVFDCDFSSSSKTAGGIVAVNKGTIDHCTSGVNITSGYINKNENKYYAPEFNSSINGEISGGIVGENSGSLTGCRSSAIVSGTICGGIAGVNTGKIYGCANNGKIGNSKAEISGGLAGKNGGRIESSYNSATVESNSENQKGSVAGINGYDGLIPLVKNVYYIYKDGINGLAPIGGDSTHLLDETNIGKTDDKEMQTAEFTETLNEVTNDSVIWKHNPNLNKGCPIIDGNFFIDSIKPAGNDITVQGRMHKALKISYDVGSKNSEEYKLLSSDKGENKILKTYSVSLTDKDGNYIPAELWCSDFCKISVPVDRENILLAGINTEGNIVYYKPDSVNEGMAVFTVSHPMSFAIVDNSPEKVTPGNGTEGSVNTGESPVNLIILTVAILALVVIFGTKRRKKVG
ncbi:MAG: hypothetical protein ACI4HZ_10955 [Ruminococcus sp.]